MIDLKETINKISQQRLGYSGRAADHQCSCGRTISAQDWEFLPLLGDQLTDEPGLVLELRTCYCGSTRATPKFRSTASPSGVYPFSPEGKAPGGGAMIDSPPPPSSGNGASGDGDGIRALSEMAQPGGES